MLIEKYTETLTNPLLPEVFQFSKRKDIFAINYEHQQIGVCNESEGFSLYTFDKELLWEINKTYCWGFISDRSPANLACRAPRC